MVTFTMRRVLRKLFVIIFVGFSAAGGSLESWAGSFRQSYFPVDALSAPVLSEKADIPKLIPVNQASLALLKTVPGMSESTALQLMRHRPFKNLEEIQHLPGWSRGAKNRLIEDLKAYLEFRL